MLKNSTSRMAMKCSLKLIIFTLILVVAVSGYEPRTCSKASDCAPDECCRLGMERYSIPECTPRGRVNEVCMEGNEPENRYLYYPNTFIRYVEGMYTLFCPCDDTLICEGNTCVAEAAASIGRSAGKRVYEEEQEEEKEAEENLAWAIKEENAAFAASSRLS